MLECHPPVTKGRIVMYTHKLDTDPSETPNISAAIVTHVYQQEVGQAQKVSLRAFHGSGDFVVSSCEQSSDPSERGKWHWPTRS